MALPSQQADFPEWYQAVVKEADLAENGPTKGTMIIKPYGYAIWEFVQRELDDRIKTTGHSNFYFPVLMPMSLLEQEAEHVEGFAPEVFTVTKSGGDDLAEPLAMRPTSEAIIWDTYGRWIQSYRDLPLLYNQWANVFRAELRPRLFLRTTEFLWQEGHTAHETEAEAVTETEKMLDVYADLAENVLGISVLRGRKSDSERFPGAVDTMTIEALMRDGKALQAGTSHYLGQNFAKTYKVQFLGRDGKQQHPHATSWGVSTRIIGGLIMSHGDDKGLRLPPAVAPHQVVIVPIYKSDGERREVLAAADQLKAQLVGIRVLIDDRDDRRPGYKFAEWELKGVPVRIELGPRDVASGSAPVARRDTDAKQPMELAALGHEIPKLLAEIQASLLQQSIADRTERTQTSDDYNQLIALLTDRAGFVLTGWCGDAKCEAKVKTDAKGTIRCLPFDAPTHGRCAICSNKSIATAAWAQAY